MAEPRPGEADMVEQLYELRDRLRRLRMDHRDPERFHVERDSICRDIGKVARLAERARR